MEWGIAACLWVPPVAFGLDLLLADPRSLPHPVQAIGRVLTGMERLVRSFAHTPQRWHGVACLMLLLLLVYGLVSTMMGIPALGVFFALYAAWSGLSLGGLLRECRAAADVVATGDSPTARQAVSMLVSRDLSVADESELYRALAETLAENFNDGFVAPFCWLLAGGPAGLWCYKAVSTVDSMWGYRTPQWAALGWAGARLDDCLAYVPARIAAVLLAAASSVARWDGWSGHAVLSDEPLSTLWGRVRRDAGSMESPNAGWPMAMAAWLHGRSMGGPTVYFGSIKEKPCLGPRQNAGTALQQWDRAGVEQLLRHVRMAGLLGAVLLWGTACVLWALLS